MPDREGLISRRTLLQVAGIGTIAGTMGVAKPVPPTPGIAAIQYVAPTGNNTDGLSWPTAKHAILAAYDALPATGGTIYIASGALIGGEVPNQGIWLLGPGAPPDPGYANPPAGWRVAKPVRFIGIGDHDTPFDSPTTLVAGPFDYNNPALPAIWISGAGGLYFENLLFQYPAVGIRLGVASNGDRTVQTLTANIFFRNVQVNIYSGQQSSTKGPAVDINWAFWIWFDQCVFLAYPNNSLTDDRRAAILVKPGNLTTMPSAGLIQISDCRFAAGNFKYYVANTQWGFAIRNCIFESDGTTEIPVPVHIIGANVFGNAIIENVAAADAPNLATTVQIEGQVTAESVMCINTSPVMGPATVINRYPNEWQTRTSTPAGQGQVSFWQGRVAAQHDSARRAFGPVAVRFPNLAAQNASTWPNLIGQATVTTNIAAPDGTQGAGRISTTQSGLQVKQVYRASPTFSVGDYVIAGVWGRAASAAGFLFNGPANVGFTNTKYVLNNIVWYITMNAPLLGDGEWEWLSCVGKVTSIDASAPTEFIMGLLCDANHPHDYYAPVLLHILAGQISDNEAAELGQHLPTWPDGVSPGTVTLLRDQDFGLQGHLQTAGRAPSASVGVDAGTGGSATVAGNDVSGLLTITTGPVPGTITPGILGAVIFARAYSTAPTVLLTPANAAAGASGIGVFVTPTNSGFSINIGQAATASTSYGWTYMVVQSNTVV